MQQRKVQAYFKAKRAINAGENVRQAIKDVGLSATTYYKYEKELGNVPPQAHNGRSQSIIETHAMTGADEFKKLKEENTMLKQLVINLELRSLQ